MPPSKKKLSRKIKLMAQMTGKEQFLGFWGGRWWAQEALRRGRQPGGIVVGGSRGH